MGADEKHKSKSGARMCHSREEMQAQARLSRRHGGSHALEKLREIASRSLGEKHWARVDSRGKVPKQAFLILKEGHSPDAWTGGGEVEHDKS